MRKTLKIGMAPRQAIVRYTRDIVAAADAFRPAALLVGQILLVCSLLAPCGPGASAPSVRHRIYERQHEARRVKHSE